LRLPVFTCAINAATPVPTRPPRVVWRAGLDINPVDLADPAEVAWLETLVWPEQTDRLARLRAAIMIATEQKPRLVKGDLRTDLAALAQEAPKDATLVIFHTAVLAYISPAAEREAFARSVASLCDYWIANEAPQVFPDIARRVGREGPGGSFLLSVNGAPVPALPRPALWSNFRTSRDKRRTISAAIWRDLISVWQQSSAGLLSVQTEASK